MFWRWNSNIKNTIKNNAIIASINNKIMPKGKAIVIIPIKYKNKKKYPTKLIKYNKNLIVKSLHYLIMNIISVSLITFFINPKCFFICKFE